MTEEPTQQGQAVFTDRGFQVYDRFTDLYGADVRVQESSLATTEAVWVFVDGGRVSDNDGSIHLDHDQARRLAKALLAAVGDD